MYDFGGTSTPKVVLVVDVGIETFPNRDNVTMVTKILYGIRLRTRFRILLRSGKALPIEALNPIMHRQSEGIGLC